MNHGTERATPTIYVALNRQQNKLQFELVEGIGQGVSVTPEGHITVSLRSQAGFTRKIDFVHDNEDLRWTGIDVKRADSPRQQPIPRDSGPLAGTPFVVETTEKHHIVVRDTYHDDPSLGLFDYRLYLEIDDQPMLYDPEIMNEGETRKCRSVPRRMPRLRSSSLASRGVAAAVTRT